MGLGTKHQQFLNSEEEQQKGLVMEGPKRVPHTDCKTHTGEPRSDDWKFEHRVGI